LFELEKRHVLWMVVILHYQRASGTQKIKQLDFMVINVVVSLCMYSMCVSVLLCVYTLMNRLYYRVSPHILHTPSSNHSLSLSLTGSRL